MWAFSSSQKESPPSPTLGLSINKDNAKNQLANIAEKYKERTTKIEQHI